MFKNRWILLWLALLAPAAFAADLGSKAPESARRGTGVPVRRSGVRADDRTRGRCAAAHWQMPDGYYLYRHRFEFAVPAGSPFALGEAEIPQGKVKNDEYFGEVQVYYHEVSARVPVTRTEGSAAMFDATITYQGCADRGLCYPPQTKHVSFPAQSIAAAAGAPSTDAYADGDAPRRRPRNNISPAFSRSGNLLLSLAIFFAAGLGLAFTPCVLPMVPILSSIIVGQGSSVTRRRAFTLSLAYVLGMAVTYAALGVIVGLFGASMNLQAALQSPPVLIVFALVFVLLAMSMFGFYELQLPQAWQNRVNAMSQNQRGGVHAGVAVMGSLSSLVVSPCLSAPLAGRVDLSEFHGRCAARRQRAADARSRHGRAAAGDRFERCASVAACGRVDEQREGGVRRAAARRRRLVAGTCRARADDVAVVVGARHRRRRVSRRAGSVRRARAGASCGKPWAHSRSSTACCC